MTAGTDATRSPTPPPADSRRTGRSVLLGVGLLLLLVALVPPFSTEARRYEFVEAIQFCILGVAVPALLVIGAPWCLLGLASPPGDPAAGAHDGRPIDRLADGRRRHPGALRSASFFVLYLAGIVLWRIPPSVNALSRHPWLVALEAVTLVLFGMGLWLELVESPPLTPRLARPHRVALAAIAMWAVWILAYLVGLSHASWYHAYAHHPGVGLSLSADQQLTTGMMWFLSACAFVPVVFWNLVQWLSSDEDPDEELHRLLRQERIRGRTVEGGPTGT